MCVQEGCLQCSRSALITGRPLLSHSPPGAPAPSALVEALVTCCCLMVGGSVTLGHFRLSQACAPGPGGWEWGFLGVPRPSACGSHASALVLGRCKPSALRVPSFLGAKESCFHPALPTSNWSFPVSYRQEGFQPLFHDQLGFASPSTLEEAVERGLGLGLGL